MNTSIKRPLLYVFAVAIFVLVAVNIYSTQWMHFTLETQLLKNLEVETERAWNTMLEDQWQRLEGLMEVVQSHPELAHALSTQDRSLLLRSTSSLFKGLLGSGPDIAITYWLPDQRFLLYVDRSGAETDRPIPDAPPPGTLGNAPARELIANSEGHLVLQMKHPWLNQEGTMIGHVVMEMDSLPLFQSLENIFQIQLFPFLPKAKVDRQKWERKMKHSSTSTPWDLLDHWVLAAGTRQPPPVWLNNPFILAPNLTVPKEKSPWWSRLTEHDHFLRFPLRSPPNPDTGWVGIVAEDEVYDALEAKHILMVLVGLAVVAIVVGLLFYRRLNRVECNIKRSIRILHDSETRYRSLLDTTMDAFISIDTHGTIIEFNKAAEAMFGYSRTEIIGARLENTIVPHHLRQRHSQGIQRFLTTNISNVINSRLELPALRKDGRIIDTELAITMAFMSESCCFSAMIRDISQKKATDRRLHLQSAALEAAASPILITNNQGIIQWSNPAFANLTGYDPAETIGKKTNILRSGEQDRTFYDDLWNTILSGRVWHREIINKKKDGTLYVQDTIITPVADHDGVTKNFISIQEDITERKLIENERNRFWLAVEQSPVTTIITDPHGQIEYVNPQFCRSTGYCQREVLGRNPRFLKADEMPSVVFDDMWATLSSGNVWRGELLNRKKDGTLFWESTLMAPIFNDFGRIQHFLAIKEDITEKKAYETALNAAKLKADAANRAKSEFLATMSHELRTPMNGILGMTDLLLDTVLDTRQRHYAQNIYRSGESLLALLNDILDFSKMESSQIRLESTNMDLRSLMDEIQSDVFPQAHRKQLSLEFSYHPVNMDTSVRGDPIRLRQIFLNLVGNAVKFTEKGSVKVVTMLQSTSSSKVNLRFEVQDTGIGIDKEAQGHIFEPFVQGDGTTTRRYGGSGLGLSIVAKLITLMGGTYGLNSISGKGTRIWFEVSLLKGDMPERRPPSPPQTNSQTNSNVTPRYPQFPGVRILVAEDFEINREMILDMLGKLGCVVDWAENGAQAVTRVVNNPPYDLIFMDMHMPEMDGLTATGRIRAWQRNENRPHIPVIAVTADAMSGDREKCLEAGVDDYLSKPYRIRDLVRMLSLWVPASPPGLKLNPQPAPSVDDRLPLMATTADAKLSPPSPAIIDIEELMRLRQEVGDELENILTVFLRILPERIEEIIAAAHNPTSLADKAHRLKGGARTLGAQQLAELCLSLEQSAKTGNVIGAQPLIDALREAAQRTEAFLRPRLGEPLSTWVTTDQV
ncbi:MAG: PAS domain S-box protein [Magnetococcales bacterium]|nr:PAS domain S-box protein [Magnetococcales bacterium]